MQVLRTDGTAPAVVARFELAPGVRSGSWDGRAGGDPAPPGTYQIVSAVRDSAGNVGRSAPPVDANEPVRAPRGERPQADRPAPADPVRAGEKGRSPSTRAAGRSAGACGGSASMRRGARAGATRAAR